MLMFTNFKVITRLCAWLSLGPYEYGEMSEREKDWVTAALTYSTMWGPELLLVEYDRVVYKAVTVLSVIACFYDKVDKNINIVTKVEKGGK